MMTNEHEALRHHAVLKELIKLQLATQRDNCSNKVNTATGVSLCRGKEGATKCQPLPVNARRRSRHQV